MAASLLVRSWAWPSLPEAFHVMPGIDLPGATHIDSERTAPAGTATGVSQYFLQMSRARVCVFPTVPPSRFGVEDFTQNSDLARTPTCVQHSLLKWLCKHPVKVFEPETSIAMLEHTRVLVPLRYRCPRSHDLLKILSTVSFPYPL